VDLGPNCSRDALARSDAAVMGVENDLIDSDMGIGCSYDARMDFAPQRIAESTEDCSGLVIVELDVPEAVLDTAGFDAAAWRTDVSCWTLVIKANSCEARLPFGEQDVKRARIEADKQRSTR